MFLLMGTPNKFSLTFLPNWGHKGEEMAETIILLVIFLSFSLSDCTDQSYKGLQTKIKNLNPCVLYVPCAGHSLVGSAVAEVV